MTASHHVELTGSLADVSFPNACAACGSVPPAGDVPLEKMFRRTDSDGPTTYEFGRLNVPLCRSCLLAHQRAERPIDPAVLRRMRWTWVLKVLPYVLPAGISAYLLVQFLPKTERLMRTPPDWAELLMLLPVLLFAALLAGFVRMSITAARPLLANTAWSSADPNETYVQMRHGMLGSWYVVPGPPTPTLAAVDFGDEQYEIFAPNHRPFRFAHPEVARRFAEVNAARVWDPNSPRAKEANRRTRTLAIAVVVVGGVIALVELVRG